MQLQISGHNLEITPAIREFAEKKFHHLKSSIHKITHAHLTLSVEKTRQIAEVQLNLPGKDIHISAEDSDLYAAIDELINKISRQLEKYKEKKLNHQD